MRMETMAALAIAVVLAMLARRSESSGLRRADTVDDSSQDDYDLKTHHRYHDFGLVRRSSGREEEAFKDYEQYGFVRYGRSDDD